MNAFARLIVVFLLAGTWAGAFAATQDDDFLAARNAYRDGDARKFELYAKRLKGYVLEPYVAYWKLSMNLDDASPDAIHAFLEKYAATPLASRLRVAWLKKLGKDQQWDAFDAEYRPAPADDIELTCYALQAKARTNPDEALQEVRPLWLTARDLPSSCTPLINALDDSGQLTAEDIWTRIRLALEVGKVSIAWRTATLLPQGQRLDLRTLMLAASDPAGLLDKQPQPMRTRAERETVMFAAYRLARSSPPQAAQQWARLESKFSPDERAYVWGQIAYFGAWRHDPSALDWYSEVDDSELSDLQLAWKARAALIAQSWSDVLDAINAMTAKERERSSWRYWKARALESLGHPDEAAAILKPLSAEYNFYGQLALEELGEPITIPATTYRPSAQAVRAMAARPGLQRALALYRLNLRLDATREWLWATRDFDDKQLLAAAEVAKENDLYDRAINTADRTTSLHNFDLRYMAPYRRLLKPYAAELDLDEAWVYGLIRQESRFIANARSGAGAGGLMQLMPATARWVAGKLGLRHWHASQVTNVSTNLNFGTYYLKHVLDALGGQTVLASAAYNAGPARARAWRPDTPVEGAIYAETIPFRETRDYVKKVMANASYYAHVFTHELQSLKQRLGIVEPPQASGDAPLGNTP